MTSQLMNHEEAISRLAAERYLLGEMKEEDRAAFEEHFLACAECFEAVNLGHDFMEQAQPVARQLRAEEETGNAPVPDPNSGNFFGRLLAGLRSPAPALAFALLLCLGGLSVYQATVISNQKKILAQAQGPSQEFRYVITGQSRSRERVITVKPSVRLNFYIEFRPGQGFTSYRADILSKSGPLKYSLPLSVSPNDVSVTFAMPAGTLGSGDYKVIILGLSPDGTHTEVGNGSFELELVD